MIEKRENGLNCGGVNFGSTFYKKFYKAVAGIIDMADETTGWASLRWIPMSLISKRESRG
jgi:hypothetical protein